MIEKRWLSAAVALTALVSLTGAERVDLVAATRDGRDPDMCLAVKEVTYAPGQGSPSHTHDATIIAYVLDGAVQSQVDDGPLRTYRRGEHWVEQPGQQHRVSRNASMRAPVSFLAVILAHKGTKGATSCGTH